MQLLNIRELNCKEMVFIGGNRVLRHEYFAFKSEANFERHCSSTSTYIAHNHMTIENNFYLILWT